MSLRSILAVACCLGIACAGQVSWAASAHSPPGAGMIKNFITLTLPGYWRVEELDLTDPVNYGNQVEPEWWWRFEAVIMPNEALFVEAGRHGNVVLVEPGHGSGSRSTLYGIVVATFHAGEWRGDTRHENRPFEHGGRPASFFEGRTVVVGSAEERELREQTQKRALEKLEAAHEAEREALKFGQAAELALARQKHDADLERLSQEHDAERKRQETEHQRELAEVSVQHTEHLAMLEAELKAKAERWRLEISESQNLIELASKATRTLDELLETEAAMLAATERVLAARRTALKKLADSLAVVAEVDGYLALLDTARKSELDWMHEAVLRHGLQGDNVDIRKAARLDLMAADLEAKPRLFALLKERLEKISDHPEFQDFLVEHAPQFISDPTVQNLLLDHLPSVQQWASRVIDSSPNNSAFGAAGAALGEPAPTKPCVVDGRTWGIGRSGRRGLQFIRVAFDMAVLFPRIEVYEGGSVGFVRKIILSDGKGNDTVYEVKDNLKQCPGPSVFRLHEHPEPVIEVTVVVDEHHLGRNNRKGIDAIGLTGFLLSNRRERSGADTGAKPPFQGYTGRRAPSPRPSERLRQDIGT